MGEKIYVSLENMRIYDGERIEPIKALDEKILDGTFRELIDVMVDTEASDIDGRNYDLEEIEYLNQIKASYTRLINNQCDLVQLYVRKDISLDNQVINGPYDLDSKPADYLEDVLEVSEVEFEGKKIPYRSLDLLIRMQNIGD